MSASHASRPVPQGPVDPYLDWAIDNNFRHFRPGAWLPMLVRFKTDQIDGPRQTALGWFTQLKWLEESLKKSVKVPELFLNPPLAIASAKSFDFCVLYVSKNDADAVTKSAGWSKTILSMSISPPLDLPSAREASKAPDETGQPDGRQSSRQIRMKQSGWFSVFGISPLGVMPQKSSASSQNVVSSASTAVQGRVALAVLDEGIAVAHERSQSATGPRIEYIWNLNDLTELTANAIKAAIVLNTANGLVDEDAVYRSIGGLDYKVGGYKALAHRRSHGTHVLSTASEMPPTTAAAQRPIIGVELPEDAVADPLGNFLYAYIFLGLLYVLRRAQSLAQGAPLPVVCNISYGPHHGPHDGTSDFEVALDKLIKASWQTTIPLEVALAAGNFRQSRVHAAFKLTPNRPRTLHWRLQPDDWLPNFMELWLPTNVAAGITLTLTPPGGAAVTISAATPSVRQPGPNGDVFWMWLLPPLNGSNRQLLLVAVQPTATDPPLDTSLPTAPSGLWTLTLTTTSNAKIEAFIGRKSSQGGMRLRGRQSYFDDALYKRFQPNNSPLKFHPYTSPLSFDPPFSRSYVRRRSTLSGIATGEHSFVVGGFRRELRQPDMPAGYTSSGPISGGKRTRPAPDLLVASEDSLTCRGVLAAGTRSGCVVAMNGTSVAAPQFARWRVDTISSGPPIAVPYVPLYAPALKNPPIGAGFPPQVVPASEVFPVAGNGCLMTPKHPYRI